MKPSEPISFNTASLAPKGLNLVAVFDLEDIPAELITYDIDVEVLGFEPKQLVLVGHGGRKLWDQLAMSNVDMASGDPIDDYSKATIADYFKRLYPTLNYQFLYPNDGQAVSLQKLGVLAGWHFNGPLRIGINHEWGSWFAYRALLLTDSNFEPINKTDSDSLQESPCVSCETKPCIAACPANALSGSDANLNACMHYRVEQSSPCGTQCIARSACPVGREHRYSDEQMRYHYARSLKTIKSYL